jgi:hypothetical protein
MKKIAIIVLFLIGLNSFVIFMAHILSFLIYVFSDAIYPGTIALVPKWIFFFAPFVLLYKTKEVRDFFGGN